MELYRMLSQASIVALLSLIVCVLPLGAGVAYGMRPTEQRLALMRPVSLAAIFSGLAGTLLGFINVLRGVAISEPPASSHIVVIGVAESLVPLFVAFGCLTVAWLSVALGLRRHP
jgi:hypothetical protein